MAIDVANNFVDIIGQEQADFDQGESANVKRSSREPVPSMKYPLLEYVKITKYGEPENFSKAKAHWRSKAG